MPQQWAQTGEVVLGHLGEPTARGDGKQNVRERVLPLPKWSAVALL